MAVSVYPMVAQIITPGAGPLCRYRMQAGDERSPRSLQTRIRSSEYCTQNRESSEKITCATLHSSFGETSFSMQHCQGKPNNLDFDQCDEWYHGTIIHTLDCNDPASIEFRHLQVSIALLPLIPDIRRYSGQTPAFQIAFQIRHPSLCSALEKFHFYFPREFQQRNEVTLGTK
ncbi:hypothetical protein TNCV_844211 [Trichonephila clavipes]|nr:hypothetical protein TNCV_844211 [Trichonephila clavipes]